MSQCVAEQRQHNVTDMSDAAFESERARLTAIAARILGSTAEAEDAVQEAWLRWDGTVGVGDPPAWLTTVVVRQCLDQLRKRRTRTRAEEGAAEAAAWTGPAGAADPAGDPENDVVVAEQVASAMQVVLDTLTPPERAAFILHDVFGYPFDDVSTILGRSGTAVRQLASRARRKVRGLPPDRAEQAVRAENREVVGAFLAAAHGGDLAGLLSLLAPDAVMRADAVGSRMGAEPVYAGPGAVADRFRGGARGARVATIDGEPGLVWMAGGEVKVAFAFHLHAGLVREIELIADPQVLTLLDVIAA